MVKNYEGRMPHASEGWKLTGVCTADGIEWHVFTKAQAHTDEWFTHKIVAKGRAPRKANYWLARNAKTGQVGFAKDFLVMRTNRPELHAKVEEMLARCV